MKNILRLAIITTMATALAAPATSYAQSRGGSHTSSSSSSTSRSSGAATRSSESYSSPSHSSSSVSRSSSSVSRSSGSVSRGSSVSRSSGSSSRSYGSQSQVSRSSSSQTRSSSPQVSRSTASGTQRSSGSVSRSSSQTRSTVPQASRSTAAQSSSTHRSAGTASRSTTGSSVSRSGVQTRTVTPGRPAGTVNGRPGGTSRGNAGVRPAGSHLDNRGTIRPVERRAGGPRIAPRDRGFIDHHAPACFYHHGPHYYGYHIHALPPHCHTHWYWGREYYFCDGLYYRYWDNYYHVCRPPYGILFDRALYNIDLVLCDIAFYSTVYRVYDAINDNNRTIQEQNEIIARNNATIAQQNSAIAKNNVIADESYQLAQRLGLVQSYADANTKYYYDDGIFFTLDKSGQYVTIVPPAGAVITELPDDYDIVNLGGENYYKVDDTIYRVVINNGKACFEVLGQLMN